MSQEGHLLFNTKTYTGSTQGGIKQPFLMDVKGEASLRLIIIKKIKL